MGWSTYRRGGALTCKVERLLVGWSTYLLDGALSKYYLLVGWKWSTYYLLNWVEYLLVGWRWNTNLMGWVLGYLLVGWGVKMSVDCSKECCLHKIFLPVEHVAPRTLQPTSKAVHLQTTTPTEMCAPQR